VFLSNRAAALLSLKRYSAAATDARRAVALAPTFGKAHARLGQALYFLKEYRGAVAAYEDAIRYEPDNQVTMTYLEKARSKMDKKARKSRGEEMSVMTGDSTQFTAMNSIATDPNASAGVVQSGYRGNSNVILNAAAGPKSPKSPKSPKYNNYNNSDPMQVEYNEEDPDFDEALRIQLRANKFLATKRYKAAIEEYTAALFLVPDDENLSPDLHMGRAHALNGSRRHESARNDAVLAIRLNPSPAAYSTLAKSLFYMKDYRGSVEAFEQCLQVLPNGEGLGMFDEAYLQKADAALAEEEASLRAAGTPLPQPKLPVPKLAPPRFVPREEAINSTPNLPPMPKEWPQQSPRSPSAFKCGPEREVMFISESLGIKLNRGSDGIVRVLSVSANTPASPVARSGKIEAGDVVREAVGVDIRRPITNIMWGDTVALIKMAPRPIVLTVAKELSEVPPAVAEEMGRALNSTPAGSPATIFRPSPSSGDGSTKDQMERQNTVSPVTLENSPAEEDAIENTLNDAVTTVSKSCDS
jgi:tetratricopeptide (TPR) repeat protein